MLGIGLLAGCGSSLPRAFYQTPSLSAPVGTYDPLQIGVPAVRHRLVHSWMKRLPPKTMLLYASDASYNAVDVYEYPSGTLAGQATGFLAPAGVCSDKSGNVYVADMGDGMAWEIAAGSTEVTNEWNVGGGLIGCSVDRRGDLAVTAYATGSGYDEPGGVTVFPHGGRHGTTYKGPGFDYPAGYDRKGNLFVECGKKSPCDAPTVYELKKGGKKWRALTLKGATIGWPGPIELMGKVLGIGDQDPLGRGGIANIGIYSARLSGTTLTVSATTVNTDDCNPNGYAVAYNWANVSASPNGLQYKGKVTATVAPNDDCLNPVPVDTWAFPGGGLPSQSFAAPGAEIPQSATLIVH
jgi:hypothetical protein